MGGSVIFYTYGSTLELNGQQLTAGMLTADLLNLSPDEYMRLKKRMTQITDLAKEYEWKRDIALWWKLNEKMDALCQKLRRYQVFRLLLDEDEDAFFSAIREITEQFSVFPAEGQAPTEEAQKRQFERVQTNSPSAVSMLPSTCSIRVRQIWKMERLFIMSCSAPLAPPGTHGVTTRSTLTATRCTSMTSVPSMRPSGTLFSSVCPSWITTARRSTRRLSTVFTMMSALRKS